METFHKLFGSLLSFVYHCFDRVVILAFTCPCSREKRTSSTSFGTSRASGPSRRKPCGSAPLAIEAG